MSSSAASARSSDWPEAREVYVGYTKDSRIDFQTAAAHMHAVASGSHFDQVSFG